MRTLLAFVTAAVAPVLPWVLYYLYDQLERFPPDDPYIWVRSRNFFLICAAISSAHVLLLGVPAYALLRWRLKGSIRWWVSISAGIVLATIPIAVFSWPLKQAALRTSVTINGVQTMVDGTPTVAGWTRYVEGVGFFGACGALSGLAFWLVWRRRNLRHSLEPNFQSPQEKSHRSLHRTGEV